MKIKIKKLYENSKLPFRKHSTDAGWDLYAHSLVINDQENQYTYGTGIAVSIPEGYVGLIFPRSSVKNTDIRLSNAVGVIDPGYHGEIMAVFDRTPFGWKHYAIGERCCQLIIIKTENVEWEEVEDLGSSKRGEGGYGSTGMK